MSSLDHRNIKWKINQNLAHVVKELQKEYPSGSPVLSESLVAQCLCGIIESAFVHGIKSAYFEKDSRRSRDTFPKPQFWNIILKISHAETVKRVDELKYISTKVGKCRAWLRLTLNDNAVTSYLTMLLSRDHKSLRTTFYHSYALLLDDEYSDIFLRHLTGIEALPFDLSFNSSILNDWTRTPLELAGLIPPSSLVPLYMTLQSKPKKDLSPSRRFISKHRASEPALLASNNFSKSLPSVGTDEWNKKYGADSGKESSPKIQEPIMEEVEGQIKEDDSVLHERKLRKRQRKSLNGHKGSVSSLSSICTSSTSGSNPSPRSTPRSTPRSGSFCEIPPVVVLQKRGSVMSERSDSKGNGISQAIKCDETITKKKNTGLILSPSKTKISSSSEDGLQFDSFPTQDESSCSPQGDTTDNGTSSSGLSSRKSSSDSDKSSVAEKPSETPLSTTLLNLNIGKIEAAIPEALNESTDAIDIYSSSYRHEPVTTNLDDSFGNSLSRAGGWSGPDVKEADNESAKSAKSSSELESPFSQNGVSSLEEPHEPIKWSTPENFSAKVKMTATETQPEIFIRREGHLKKLGETLKQWKDRWCILRGKTLSYYRDKKAIKPLLSIDLTEVSLITQKNLDNGADFMITISNGVKHHFKAENKLTAVDWVTDIRLMIQGVRLPEKKTELYEDIYSTNYMEEYEIITVADPVFKTESTSWFASMVSLMSKMPCEKGLDSQCYQCADCASPIGIIHGFPRVCGFTGRYYCSQCHVNDETHIPARIIRNWDFRKYKVAKRSKTFLDQVFSEPHLNVFEVNPGVYKYIDEMGKVLQLRQRLVHLKSYLQTCRSFDMEDLTKKLGSRPHFLENCHLYSVQDFCGVNDKSLATELTKIVNNGTKHVYNCPLCSAKGFICEQCKSDKVIFPFEVDTSVQCFECKGVFHRECKTDTCPRCERRQQRMLKDMEQAGQRGEQSD